MSWLWLSSDPTHIFKDNPPPYSSSQTWLHIRIIWGSLTNYRGLAPTPAIQIQLVWGVTWVIGVINAPQVILNCSHIWERLSSSFFSVTQCLWVQATSGLQYNCCVAWRGAALRGCLLQPKQKRRKCKGKTLWEESKGIKERERNSQCGEEGQEAPYHPPPCSVEKHRILWFCWTLVLIYGRSMDELAT